ncbi:Retrotransposon-derived protein peg10 [Ceratobasidium sp. 370]|nr:Retrotransposon-derived protein peg10 [Ceratobasidium sp. 370]
MGEGLPSRWANRYLEKIIEMEDDPALKNIAVFRDAFLSQWGDPVAKQNAEWKIRALYQKGSAADYATEFCMIMPDLEWDNQALKGQFWQGPKPEVRSKMIELTVLSGRDIDAASLDEHIKMAIVVDNCIFEGKRDSRFHKPQEKKNKRLYLSVPTTNGKGAYVTPVEKDRRRKAGLCIKCMKAGHTVAVCPSKEWIGGDSGEKGRAVKVDEEGGSSRWPKAYPVAKESCIYVL